MSDRVTVASDGIRARLNGAYAREKLRFLDQFGPPALEISGKKLDRVYLDLFAGPGLSVDEAGAEFVGSPLRAVGMTSTQGRHAFTAAHLVNMHPADHAALEARIRAMEARQTLRVPARKVILHNEDANVAVSQVLRGIHPKAYIFTFADIEGVRDLPFETLQRLCATHTSVDLYVLFPLSMTVNRLISVANGTHTERHAAGLTAFFGTEAWRQLVEARITDAQSPALRAGLEDLYVRQLRQLWKHAGRVADVRRRGSQSLYRMLFATNDENAKRLAQWFADGGPEKQTTLF